MNIKIHFENVNLTQFIFKFIEIIYESIIITELNHSFFGHFA
jgi:hypothetical protein